VKNKLMQWQTYTFSVEHGREGYPDTITKSVDVAVLAEKPPIIRCPIGFKMRGDQYKLRCIVVGAKADDVSFIKEEDDDTSELEMALIGVTTQDIRRKNIKVAISILYVSIPTDVVTEGSKYKFKVSASKGDLVADDVFRTLIVEEPPQNCEGIVSPEEGVAGETEFSISIVCDDMETEDGEEVDADDVLVAEVGPVIADKKGRIRWRKGSPESIREPINIGMLDMPGTIQIRTRVRNKLSKLFTVFKTEVTVKDTEKEPETIAEETDKKAEKSIENGDCKRAFDWASNGCEVVTRQLTSNKDEFDPLKWMDKNALDCVRLEKFIGRCIPDRTKDQEENVDENNNPDAKNTNSRATALLGCLVQKVVPDEVTPACKKTAARIVALNLLHQSKDERFIVEPAEEEDTDNADTDQDADQEADQEADQDKDKDADKDADKKSGEEY